MIWVVHDLNPRALSPKLSRLRAGAELVPGPDADHRRAVGSSHDQLYRAPHPVRDPDRVRGQRGVLLPGLLWRPAIRCRRSCRRTPRPKRSPWSRHAYGFDQPIPMQFLKWLWHVLTGDFGRSIATRRPVTAGSERRDVQHRHPGHVRRAAVVSRWATRWAPSPGASPASILDRLITGTAVMGVRLPNYWLGIVLVIMFAVEMMALPATGMGSQRIVRVQHLPLGRRHASWCCRSSRCRWCRSASSPAPRARRWRRCCNQDFVTTLRAKGLGEFAVIRHVLKNACRRCWR